MRTVLRNVLCVIAGIAVGSVVNMALVMLGPVLIPPPPGVDMTKTETLAAAIAQLEPRHFVMPFLAHALGTLAGALAAYLVAASRKVLFAWGIGVVFLAGGIAACFMIPAPAWFMALDLLAAYLPMAWLAIQLGRRILRGKPPVLTGAV